MGAFKYLSNANNKISGATVTPSSTAAGYAAANITLLPISKPHRFTSDATENYVIDLGSAQAIDFIAVINHNLSLFGATIQIRAGTTSAVSDYGPTVLTWRKYDIYKGLGPQQTYRYWKIEFTDASNPDGFIQVGYVMLGILLELNLFSFEWQTLHEILNVEHISEFGAPHVANLHRRKRLRLLAHGLTVLEASTLVTLYDGLSRNLIPVFIIPDDANYDGYFGRVQNQFEEAIGVLREIRMEFLEDGRGNLVTA